MLLTEPFGGAFFRSAATSCHAEHGASVLVGLDSDIVLYSQDRLTRSRAVMVPPDVPYEASCPGPVVLYVFDPELCPRVAGAARALGVPRAIDGAAGVHLVSAVFAHRAELTRPEVLAGIGNEAQRALASGSARVLDRRIERLVEALRDPAADRAAAIARTSLSAAHLQALFARDIGLPMRTYGLWRRTLHALAIAARVTPTDLTAAAHATEFADLAHFSRTCRRMLGYAPSALRANLIPG